MVSHYDFDLRLIMANEKMLPFFPVLFSEKCLFNQVVYLFVVNLEEFLIYSGY